ncbi:hypothetical protein BaRGS_00000131 [Batillaria attramentaria]|uniref:Glycoside-hydrolase family GH114 TIM-barrel domain-containing protein n=1 Tax=Batillaria attramentaria TaxID=370345 RepID=A0ABD0M9F4_9CAEN
MKLSAVAWFLLLVEPVLGRWNPHVGTTFQIQYSQSTTDLSVHADAFDLDLDDPKLSSYIHTLHSQGKHVICYFSAGTWENYRDDVAGTQHDLGNTLEDWPDERWWDIRASSVRHVITKRLDRAKSMGCDAVDPDNVDGYTPENRSGLGLTKSDTISFLTWMSDQAHSRGMSIGLKNAIGLIPSVESHFDFAVNEQCLKYNECDAYQRFLDHNKAVFHIEYTTSQSRCDDQDRLDGMTTVLKHTNLNNWRIECHINLVG